MIEVEKLIPRRDGKISPFGVELASGSEQPVEISAHQFSRQLADE
jgi:hypothetical protein